MRFKSMLRLIPRLLLPVGATYLLARWYVDHGYVGVWVAAVYGSILGLVVIGRRRSDLALCGRSHWGLTLLVTAAAFFASFGTLGMITTWNGVRVCNSSRYEQIARELKLTNVMPASIPSGATDVAFCYDHILISPNWELQLRYRAPASHICALAERYQPFRCTAEDRRVPSLWNGRSHGYEAVGAGFTVYALKRYDGTRDYWLLINPSTNEVAYVVVRG